MHLLRRRILLALAAALLFPGIVEAQGILLLAHGGRGEWNEAVLELASEVDSRRPVEVAFGMANRRTIQDAVDRLTERDVAEIVAVPLFVSSHSSVMRATEYLLGQRDEAPPQLEAFGRMAARRAAAASGSAPDGDWTTPIEAPVPISIVSALDDHALVSEILLSRAMDISERPGEEVVVLVAHGPARMRTTSSGSTTCAFWLSGCVNNRASVASSTSRCVTMRRMRFRTERPRSCEPWSRTPPRKGSPR